MTGFLVGRFGYKEKRLVKKIVNKKKIEKYSIYSLNKDDIKRDVEYLNINKEFFKIQDVAFNLLGERKREAKKVSEVLSLIMGLDLDMFTKRLLLNKVFYKEAQFLMGEEILLKQKGIKNVIILNKYRDILTNKNNVINYSNSLDIILLLKPILRYIIRLLILSLIRLKNLKEDVGSIKLRRYDIIAIQVAPLCYHLIEKTLGLLKGKYSIAIASGFGCNKELIPFKVQENINKVKICPKVRIIDILKIFKIFYLLKLNDYKWEIINYFDSMLFRKIMCEYVAKRFKPKLILVKNEYDLFENIEYKVFDKYGIKYIDYMHGEHLYYVRDSFLEYHKMVVWGKYYRKLLEEKLRVKEGMIEVIGNQLFDEIPSYRIKNKNLPGLINKYNKIISVFTQSTYGFCGVDSQSIMIQKVVDFMKKNKGIYMILKHHHLEFKYPVSPYDLLIKSIKDRVLECTNEIKLYDILSISDLIINPSSAVGLEGILFKKPVLYMNFGDTPHLLEYPKVNAAVEINNPENSEFYLNKMLFDKKFINNLRYEKVIEDWANGLDENSHIRFEKLIEEQIS